MKRALPFLLILALICVQLPHFLAVPAQAAETDELSVSYNLLDYNVPGRITASPTGSYSFSVLPVNPIVLNYIDIVIYTVSTPSSAYIDASYATFNLDITSIGEGFYRLSGNANSAGFSTFKLVVTLSWSNYFSIVRANVTTSSGYVFDTNADIDLTTPAGDYSYSYSPGDTGALKHISYSGSYLDTEFNMFIEFPKWQNFDYIDVQLYICASSIQSIGAFYGGQSLVCDVSTIENSNTVGGYYYITVRIDVRNLSPGDIPNLLITGAMIVTDANFVNTFSVLSVSGLLNTNNSSVWARYLLMIQSYFTNQNSVINSAASSIITDLTSALFDRTENLVNNLTILFGNLSTSLSNLFSYQNQIINDAASSIVSALDKYFSSSGAGEAVKQESQQISTSMNDAVADLGAINRPASSDVNNSLDISGIITPSQISGSTSFLTALFDVPSLLQVVTLALILSLAATVLFGKR